MQQEKYKLRPATQDDITKILALHVNYYKKTKYYEETGDYDAQETIDTINYCVVSPDAFTLVVERRDKAIVAVVVGYYSKTYWRIPDLSIELAYIEDTAQDIYIRDLLKEAITYGVKKRKVMYLRAAGESRIDETATHAYTNSLMHLGFEPMGRNCIKYIGGRQDDGIFST